MKKLCLFLLLCGLAAGQSVPKNVTKLTDGTNAITESLAFPTGKTGSFLAGSTLSIAGTLSGTPTGGTLNLSALTLTLPATVSGGTSTFQPLDSDLTAIAALTTTSFGRSLLTEASATSLRTTLSVLSSSEIAAAYQPLDATLTALGGVTTVANKLIYATGSDVFATTDLTSYGRTLIALSAGTSAQYLRSDGTHATLNQAAVAGLTTTDDVTHRSLAAGGTAGAGFVQIANQSSAPGTPTAAGRIYFDASNRFSWIGTNGFTRTFDGTANTANRMYTLPDADSKIPVFGQTITFAGPTAARTITLPDASFTAARIDSAQTFTGTQTFGSGTQTLAIDNTATLTWTPDTTLTTAGGFKLYGKTGNTDTAQGVAILAPAGGDANMWNAFDMVFKGTPSNKVSRGVCWIDICSNNDATMQGGTFEALTLGKYLNGVAYVKASAGGSGTVRQLVLNPDGNQVGIGALSPNANGGLLDITKNSTYTTEAAGLTIHTGVNAQPELLAGVANAAGFAYVQSASLGTSFTTIPLYLNPNGGNVVAGTTTRNFTVDISSTALVQLTQPTAGSYSVFRFVNSGTSGQTFDIGVGGHTTGDAAQDSLYFYNGSIWFTLSTAGVGRFKATTEATTGGIGALLVDGGLYVSKKIISASTLTTAAGVTYDFGAADATTITTPDKNLKMTVAGTDYYLPAKLTKN